MTTGEVSLAVPEVSAGRPKFVALRTPEQLEAEALALRVLAHPKVRRVQAQVRAYLLDDPAAATEQGRAQIDYTLALWTGSVVMQHAKSDLDNPSFLWGDNTPHRWFGFESAPTGTEGENADNVYRSAYIDGAHRYEIRGHVPENGPSQFSFDLERAQPGKVMLLDTMGATEVDPGLQVGMLPDTMIDLDANGDFRIGVGPEPGPSRNYLQSRPGSCSILYRNSLSDWRQTPTSISIRRLDPGPPPAPLSEDEIAARVAEDLPAWVAKWARMKDVLMGANPPFNTLVGPWARHGNWWGVIAGGRYRIAEDEALLATIGTGEALYTGVQICNRWFMAPDATRHFGSRSLAQAQPNADGSYTYVISPSDPGAFNWASTAGSHEGYMSFRWQQMPESTDLSQLIKRLEIVKLRDLRAALPPATSWVTPSERAADLAERGRQFAMRYND